VRVVRRDPTRGYLDTWLWVPKQFINVDGTKEALTWVFSDSHSQEVRYVYLWRETEHHLLLPRAFWKAQDLPFDVVDCRPRTFPSANITSKIKLDHKKEWQPDGSKALVPTGRSVQQESVEAMLREPGGILQLACVTGDTTLSLNRGGKGFKTTVKKAYERWSGKDARYSWVARTPTRIRSLQGDQIRLQEVVAFIDKGERVVYTLKLVDGKELRLTSDHKVLTSKGYVHACLLRPGDEVVVDGKREGPTRTPKKKLAYRRIGGFKFHPHARYQSRSYCIEEHRALVEAEMNSLTLDEFRSRCQLGETDGLVFIDPRVHHVHHKDEDITNNDLKNLEVLKAADHCRLNDPDARRFGLGVPNLVAVESCLRTGKDHVYDVMCEGPHHNFVANGIVVHNCGLGKTVVFLEVVALLNMPALVIVDTTQLLYQWREEILSCLDVPGGIGLIQGESFDWEKDIVLATYQTIANRSDSMPEVVRRHFGVIGWDEGHHISAPTYAAGAHLFYGRRYALTATPERDDGLHIIYRFHVGEVLYKDLSQDIKPDIVFRWTACELDGTVPENEILDVNQQLSTSKLAVWYGKWIKRMMLVLNDAKEAVQAGRKIIVLSNSVDEAVNFLAIWTWGYPCGLYTDIPMPTSLDVGETLSPVYLEAADRKKFKHRLKQATEQLEKNNKRLASKTLHPVKREEIQKKRDGCKAIIAELEQLIEQDKVGRKIMKEKRRRQKEYRDMLLACSTTGGLMIHKVKPDERARLLRTMPITFAIAKYGKEALDCQELDTVLVSMPFSSRNGLQQVMGRPSREDSRKMHPMVVIYEDNIGPIIGMCKKLRNHINEWPLEDNGPYHYYLFGHPHARNTWKTTVFGP
jgi:superfamily II DNA or RNA helicase